MKHFLTSFLAVSACVFSSCIKHSEIKTYGGVDNIYFTSASGKTVSFAFFPNITDSLVKIPVMVMGMPTGADRPYELQVAAGSTAKEGVQYDFYKKDFFIPAHAVSDTVEVMLHRTADLKEDTVSLRLELKPNQYFKTEMRNVAIGKTASYVSYTLSSTDVLTKPSAWYDYLLGRFTVKKFLLMGSLMELDLSRFTGAIPTDELIYYEEFMKRYLARMKADGHTVYEDDGTEMTMGQ